VNQHALVVAEIAEFVRFDFVLFGFGVVDIAFTGTVSPGAFDHALFAEEVSCLDGVSLICAAKDDPIAQIQREHFRLVIPLRRH